MDLLLIEIIALAGGGGSSGGGGGGGGSSGGSSSYSSSGGSGGGEGDPRIFLFMLLGGVFIYFMVIAISKAMSLKRGILSGIALGIIGAIAAGIIFGFDSGFGLIFGGVFGLVIASSKRASRFVGNFKIKKKLEISKSQDPTWDETTIIANAKQVFANYQNDWSKFNYEGVKKYTTPEYYEHARLMMLGLQQMGRRNEVVDPTVKDSYITDAFDSPENSKDTVEVYIFGSAKDVLLDEKNNQTLYSNQVNFQEYWTFNRNGKQWLLAKIAQQTASLAMKNQAMEDFAANKMHYSLDWGRLLLPSRGQLFGKANFKYSDINNHVIGDWQDLLVQLYTYIPVSARSGVDNYLVAQINLPKSYGGIVINRRGGFRLFSRGPKDYQKVTFEWPDFNKRYDVFATDMDKVTSFELLNPKFMADLYDKNLKVNIEVVDNTVYLFSQVKANENRYADMLEILKQAFKELKR